MAGASPPGQLTRTVVAVAGIRSPLVQAGPADASEAVVFFHGNPGSSEDWLSVVGRVGEFARAVAFDQPGFGNADKPAGFDHTYTGHAAHIARALDELGIERAHVVGHDLGGRWMLDWASMHPDRFASAVVVAGGVLLDYRWHYLAKIWRTPVVGDVFMRLNSRPAFRVMLRRGNPRGLPREFVDRMYDDMDARTRRAILSLYRPKFDWNQRSYELSGTLRRLDRPALIVWGKHDPYIPVAQAARQRESLPHAELLIQEDSGHWPFIDDSGTFEQAVVRFLRQQVTGRHPQ
jgi:pimeloyl-ACP methyl ester carboxylesterase